MRFNSQADDWAIGLKVIGSPTSDCSINVFAAKDIGTGVFRFLSTTKSLMTCIIPNFVLIIPRRSPKIKYIHTFYISEKIVIITSAKKFVS